MSEKVYNFFLNIFFLLPANGTYLEPDPQPRKIAWGRQLYVYLIYGRYLAYLCTVCTVAEIKINGVTWTPGSTRAASSVWRRIFLSRGLDTQRYKMVGTL